MDESNEIFQEKLRQLITICKRTKNYKKLAVVGFILISNRANEIGIKLGLRPRNKKEDESLYEYFTQINRFLEKNFDLILFQQETLAQLKKYEILFTKAHGDLPFVYLSDIFSLYYTLRRIEIPDMWKHISHDHLTGAVSDLSLYSSFFSSSHGRSKREGNSEMMKNLMLHHLREEERTISSQLKDRYDPKAFESAIILKKVRTSLEQNNGGKIKIRGTLKDNFVYTRSVSSIIGYFLLGIFFLLFGIGIVFLFEVIAFPLVATHMSMFILLFFGSAAFFFYIYWSKFMRAGD